MAMDLRVDNHYLPQSSPSAEGEVQEGKVAQEPAEPTQEPAATAETTVPAETSAAETVPQETKLPEKPQVSPEETQKPEPPRFPSRDGGKMGVVTARNLDIRSSHDLNAEVIVTLHQGTNVYVFERWESEDKVPWA